MVFDYCHAQYMFSTATILAISMLWDRSTSNLDRDRFECVADLLLQLKSAGNLPAAEFHRHISATTPLVVELETRLGDVHRECGTCVPGSPVSWDAGIPAGEDLDLWHFSEDTLSEPLFRDFLAQPEADLNFIDEAMLFNDGNALYWPQTDL
jgi:hypothetical protein